METRFKRKSGLSMRASNSSDSKRSHHKQSTYDNKKHGRPEINLMVLPPPSPLTNSDVFGFKSTEKSDTAASKTTDQGEARTKTPIKAGNKKKSPPSRAESTPKRSTEAQGSPSSHVASDSRTPQDKSVVPEDAFSPIELYPCSQTEALVCWDWQTNDDELQCEWSADCVAPTSKC